MIIVSQLQNVGFSKLIFGLIQATEIAITKQVFLNLKFGKFAHVQRIKKLTMLVAVKAKVRIPPIYGYLMYLMI